MLASPEQQKIQEDIFYQHWGLFGFPENFEKIRVLHASNIYRYIDEVKNKAWKIENNIFTHSMCEKLEEFRLYILSLDGYSIQWDFQKIQSNKEWFQDISIQELLWIFENTYRKQWDRDKEYYFAMFEAIEDKLEQIGIDLWFNNLYEQWV